MSAKSKDTTKTAHVMNLLRKNTAAAPTPAAEPVEKQEPVTKPKETVEAAPVRPAPAQHPIIASLNEEAAVSQEIKDALEQELMEEGVGSAEEPAAPEEPVPTEPTSEPEAVVEEPATEEVSAIPEPTQVEETPEPEAEFEELVIPVAPPAAAEETTPMEEVSATPEPTPVKEAPAPAEEPPAPEPQAPPVEICNVMQLMVEENVEKYLKMMKLCDCPRCKADVQALALSNLPPKYVVMGTVESIPRLTMYRWQYQVEVTAQILRACEVVAEHPRHDPIS